MREIGKYKITKNAMELIECDCEVDITTLSLEKIYEIVQGMYGYDKLKLIVDGNDEFVWIEDDVSLICYISDSTGFIGDRDFFEIKEFNIYFAENKYDGKYYVMGDVGDASSIFDFLEEDEKFNRNVNNLHWVKDDNILHQALYEYLEEVENEDEENDYIEPQVFNQWGCTLEDALRKYEEYDDLEFEKMGCFAGEIIYRIGERLYYISDDSYSFNTEHYYYMREVSGKCYSEFGLNKPYA